MTKAFAKEHGVQVQQRKGDKNVFAMGSGQYVTSIGKAFILLKILGRAESDETCWFHVLEKCSISPIMGVDFLRKIQLCTKNRHLLVDCPLSFGDTPRLKWIGSPQGKMQFWANNKRLTACADTGSDLDLMSLHCALKRGFKIDKSRRTRVLLADETVVETVGQVHISSVKLSSFDSFEMSLHVLLNLVSDVIFGEEFLEQMDVFNTCDIIDEDDSLNLYSLNTLISFGPIQSFMNRVANIRNRREL